MYYLTSMSDISSSPTSHLNHTAYSLPPSLLRPSRCFDKELLSHSSHSFSTSKLLAHSVCPYFQSMSQVGVSALHHDCYFLRSSYYYQLLLGLLQILHQWTPASWFPPISNQPARLNVTGHSLLANSHQCLSFSPRIKTK